VGVRKNPNGQSTVQVPFTITKPTAQCKQVALAVQVVILKTLDTIPFIDKNPVSQTTQVSFEHLEQFAGYGIASSPMMPMIVISPAIFAIQVNWCRSCSGDKYDYLFNHAIGRTLSTVESYIVEEESVFATRANFT